MVVWGCSPSPEQSTDVENTMVDHHNSQNSLDWSGTYTGLLPCASCEGIRTDLVLNDDMTFVLTTFYVGENDDEIVETGSFTWNDAGNTVVLDGLTDRPNQFFVGENMLFQLDMDGNRITGDMADAYKLTRDMSNELVPTNSMTDTRFELVELMGQPITQAEDAQARIHLFLSSSDSTASGYAGCNSFSGTFEIKDGSRIRFSKMASTLRACLDMETETELMKVYETTDNYNFDGTNLVLNKARMAPLARFVAVRN
jgi:heat shock protein HslJ